MIDVKIYTFLTLARVKSYTKTAEILNATQPAITQHIKNIERKYNIKLFERNTKKVSLTKEGKVFYDFAQKLYQVNEELNSTINHSHILSGTIRIGATRTMAEDIAPDILEQFHTSNPNVFVEVIIDSIDNLIDLINKREICLALIDGPVDKTKYQTFKLKDDLLYIISSKENILSDSHKITFEDIKNQPFILREKGSGTRKILENSLLNFGYTVSDLNTILEVNSVRFVKKMVNKNIGISLVSYERIRHEIEYNMLNYYELEGLQAKRECNIVYLKDSARLSFIKSFINSSKKTDYISAKALATKPW